MQLIGLAGTRAGWKKKEILNNNTKISYSVWCKSGGSSSENQDDQSFTIYLRRGGQLPPLP